MENYEAELFNRASSHYSNAIVEALKELLQKGHLYQNQEVVLPDFNLVYEQNYKILLEGLPPRERYLLEKTDFEEIFQIGQSIFWSYTSKDGGVYTGDKPKIKPNVEFIPSTVRLYCSNCDYLQPYNFMSGENVTERNTDGSKKKIEQVFTLVYQCQGCKSIPEVFLVRRVGMKFILSGRTPMEKIVVKDYIPKPQRKFFSDAVIAYNSGQTLPGNFMLRTFIEQFVRSRSETPLTTNIEALFDEYNSALPEDFKTRFPSLRRIYDLLSEDIHAAIGSKDLFSESKDKIERHFDARRLYEFPD